MAVTFWKRTHAIPKWQCLVLVGRIVDHSLKFVGKDARNNLCEAEGFEVDEIAQNLRV